MITDDMCKRAIEALQLDRIQGFSSPPTPDRPYWGRPHTVRDVSLPADQQELWRGDSHADMVERCNIEEMRLALQAGLAAAPTSMSQDAERIHTRLLALDWVALRDENGKTAIEAAKLIRELSTLRGLAAQAERDEWTRTAHELEEIAGAHMPISYEARNAIVRAANLLLEVSKR